MFGQWEQQGIYVKITQTQYDALVSMAFNMGVSRFRQTDFVQKLKKNEIEEAAELIKTTGLRTGFRGLNGRRMEEYKKFISEI